MRHAFEGTEGLLRSIVSVVLVLRYYILRTLIVLGSGTCFSICTMTGRSSRIFEFRNSIRYSRSRYSSQNAMTCGFLAGRPRLNAQIGRAVHYR